MDNLNNKLSDEAQSQPSCLGAVSWCVSLWAVSVCFCAFLRREGKNNYFDLQ